MRWGHPAWECACGVAVQEFSCLAYSQSEQCSLAWHSGGGYGQKGQTQMPHLEVQEHCGSRGCAGCERRFSATSHSNPSGGERKRGLRVIRLLLLVEKDTRREKAEWHKSSMWFSPQDFGILLRDCPAPESLSSWRQLDCPFYWSHVEGNQLFKFFSVLGVCICCQQLHRSWVRTLRESYLFIQHPPAVPGLWLKLEAVAVALKCQHWMWWPELCSVPLPVLWAVETATSNVWCPDPPWSQALHLCDLHPIFPSLPALPPPLFWWLCGWFSFLASYCDCRHGRKKRWSPVSESGSSITQTCCCLGIVLERKGNFVFHPQS